MELLLLTGSIPWGTYSHHIRGCNNEISSWSLALEKLGRNRVLAELNIYDF